MTPGNLDPDLLRGARWFAGKGRSISSVCRVGEYPVPGGGALLLADISYDDDRGVERYLLLEGSLRWRALVDALRTGPLNGGPAGRLELRAGAGFDSWLGDGPGTERVPSTDQSNTLVVLDERLLVKAYRLLCAGVHPEIEVATALEGSGAPVPAYGGAIVMVAPDETETAIALLQEFVPGTVDAWEAAIAVARADLVRGGASEETLEFGRAAGTATARLHRALAGVLNAGCAEVLPSTRHAEALQDLEHAVDLDPRVAARRDDIREALAPLAADGGPPLQRIHGDLHVAQLLSVGDSFLIVDFEGVPTLALERRRAHDTPLRDLATLRRSFDHLASAAARSTAVPETITTAWSTAACTAVTDAYIDELGNAAIDAELLHALELTAECRELAYAHAMVPDWAYVAHAGFDRLLAGTAFHGPG